jgi:hypothetical protein
VRPHPHGVDLGRALVLDPGREHVLGEHVALEQEVVIRLELVERLVEAAGIVGMSFSSSGDRA